jgi:ABC-type antimicrobial peptide transport system permease subunit
MLSLLAALGFVLAALGLYGLIGQTAIERRREFGIRLALGAGPGDIVRLVGRYAVAVTSIGIALGLTFSYYGSGILQSLLFGVTPLDPAVYVLASSTLAAVVVVACAGPAWRAMRVAPVAVLRAE